MALSGCAEFDKSLGQQQVVVTFTSQSTNAQRLHVVSVCAKSPQVTAPALPSDLNSPYALQQLTYGVNHASPAQVVQLEKCLGTFDPSIVAGYYQQDSSDAGD